MSIKTFNFLYPKLVKEYGERVTFSELQKRGVKF